MMVVILRHGGEDEAGEAEKLRAQGKLKLINFFLTYLAKHAAVEP